AALIADNTTQTVYFKHALPNYAVFDEKRYFTTGSDACVVDFKGFKLGITICEDLWVTEPALMAKDAGAELILNISASPFNIGKVQARLETFRSRVTETNLPIMAVNLVGGQDELVFDGSSFVLDSDGQVIASLAAFEESMALVTANKSESGITLASNDIAPSTEPLADIYMALVTGVRDYIHKNGFQGVVIGLSGGVDSALTLAIAHDALGSEHVEVVMLPSRYTRDISQEDAAQMAENLNVKYAVISIEKVFQSFTETLAPEFEGLPEDVTEENIQARCRGIILMAISNKKGKMLLTTGNKSEMAMGYSTLYGDMAGGFNPLKDLSKTLVYELCDYRNSLNPDIPQRILDREPSAELRADQTDQDSLPPYSVLDAILELYVEQDASVDTIIAKGFEPEVVKRIVRLLDINEHKRRQAPPGVRITARAFGKDRRYPITSGYR
ncbi:MAG: NAD+ synthase, partial [Gammaproteobacteria bacterium]|nr:NAD+ synthase [Gammaproteobacteria bacterium]